MANREDGPPRKGLDGWRAPKGNPDEAVRVATERKRVDSSSYRVQGAGQVERVRIPDVTARRETPRTVRRPASDPLSGQTHRRRSTPDLRPAMEIGPGTYTDDTAEVSQRPSRIPAAISRARSDTLVPQPARVPAEGRSARVSSRPLHQPASGAPPRASTLPPESLRPSHPVPSADQVRSRERTLLRSNAPAAPQASAPSVPPAPRAARTSQATAGQQLGRITPKRARQADRTLHEGVSKAGHRTLQPRMQNLPPRQETRSLEENPRSTATRDTAARRSITRTLDEANEAVRRVIERAGRSRSSQGMEAPREPEAPRRPTQEPPERSGVFQDRKRSDDGPRRSATIMGFAAPHTGTDDGDGKT